MPKGFESSWINGPLLGRNTGCVQTDLDLAEARMDHPVE